MRNRGQTRGCFSLARLCGWAAILVALGCAPAVRGQSFADVAQQVEPKMVKIYGAGGLQRLEAYQSGFLISGDGLVLTSWSYVLDTDDVAVTLSDGRRFSAELLGADPRLEIAVLKIPVNDVDHFDLAQTSELTLGDRVLAFSNLYGVASGNEPTSVQHGCVMAITPLDARRGAHRVPFQGAVYVLDAMTNNAGAAGGALTDREGKLAGFVGREVRDARSNIWLNYAIPIATLRDSIEKIKVGELVPRLSADELIPVDDPWTLDMLGLQFVPNVLPKTPAYIDHVRPESPGARAGFIADDLVLYVNERLVRSIAEVKLELSLLSQEEPLAIVVQRGAELHVLTIDPL